MTRRLIVCVGGVALAALDVALASDWPCWRGQERNGRSAETGLAWNCGTNGLPVLWRAEVGKGFSGFAVAAGDRRTALPESRRGWNGVRRGHGRCAVAERAGPPRLFVAGAVPRRRRVAIGVFLGTRRCGRGCGDGPYVLGYSVAYRVGHERGRSDHRRRPPFCVGRQQRGLCALRSHRFSAARGVAQQKPENGRWAVAPASPDGFRPFAQGRALAGRCWTSPALAGGRLYVRNAQGDAVCLLAVLPAR